MVIDAKVTLTIPPEQIARAFNAGISTSLVNPNSWFAIADEMGEHDHVYDLGDSSERLDVVQLVCEAIARRLRTALRR